MWILVRVEPTLGQKVMAYLKRRKIWHREFAEEMYNLRVTAEQRANALHTHRAVTGKWGQLNPPAAWKTCASYDPNGKRKVDPSALRDSRFIPGTCAAPNALNDISCPMWCTKYQPTTVEGMTALLQQTIDMHQDRIRQLQGMKRKVKHDAEQFTLMARSGLILTNDNKTGEYVLTYPQRTHGS